MGSVVGEFLEEVKWVEVLTGEGGASRCMDM